MVLVELKLRGDRQSIRNRAGAVVLACGQQRWGAFVRPFAMLVPRECTSDLSQLPEPNYEDHLGRAWILPPELQTPLRFG
jgi:hypothetical protein